MTNGQLREILALHKKWVNDSEEGKQADLSGANLSGANLSGADLRDADLRDANLYGAYLRNTYLRDADLRRANLYGANLRNTDLRDADLRNTNLYGADLCEADLSGANLSGADLRGANLCEAKGIDHFIFAKALGSRKDETQWNFKNDILLCGCFRGTMVEFAAKVEITHKNNHLYLAEYQAMIQFFKDVRDARQRAERYPTEPEAEA